MENKFDHLAEELAGNEPDTSTPIPRREALRKVGLGLAGALLASLGLSSGALAAPHSKTGGGGTNACTAYCRQFATKAERDHCQQVCQSCASTTMLCGTNAFSLVCCSGVCCSGVCANLSTDSNNCGACGRSCGSLASVNLLGTCVSGTCAYTCATGFADCDQVASNGCETYILGDQNNCGACGNVCAVGQACCNGVCIDVANDPNNCGQCGYSCSAYAGVSYCCGGACSDLTTDSYNCGACGIVCPSSAPTCQNGTCVCTTNTWCNGVCVDLSSDSNNCGTCGSTCPDGYSCVGGVCGCAGAICNGACVNIAFDTANCGGCGIACVGGESCIGGICQSPF